MQVHWEKIMENFGVELVFFLKKNEIDGKNTDFPRIEMFP